MSTLRELWATVDKDTPMRAVSFEQLEELGHLPRSSDQTAMQLQDIPVQAKIVYISHRWARPWQTMFECMKYGHKWAGMAHPDNEEKSKYVLMCKALKALASKNKWDISKVYVWLDFACIDQDDRALWAKGVASLRGYIVVCDALMILSPKVPAEGARYINLVPGEYGERAWTLLEALLYYGTCSIRGGEEAPDIWVAADDPNSVVEYKKDEFGKSFMVQWAGLFLERFSYVLTDLLPRNGALFNEGDRRAIVGHEDAILAGIEERVKRRGYVTRHNTHVSCVAFNHMDAGHIASGDYWGYVRIVKTDTGTARHEWRAHPFQVTCISWSGDGKMLITASRKSGHDKPIKIWAFEESGGIVLQHTLYGHTDDVTSVCVSIDGSTVASGSRDKTVKIWGFSDWGGAVIKHKLEGHTDGVTSLCMSGDGKTIASGSDDRTLKIWTLFTNKGCDSVLKYTLQGHTRRVTCVCMSRDGRTTASGSEDATVNIWGTGDGDGGTLRYSLEGHWDCVISVCMSGDGRRLASGSKDSTVKFWEVGTENGPQLLHTLEGHTKPVNSVCMSVQGRTVASGSDDHLVKIWSLEDENYGDLPPTSIAYVPDDLKRAAFSGDGRMVAGACTDGSIMFWGVSSHGVELKHSFYGQHKTVVSITFSPDSALVATSSSDGPIMVWDAASAKLVHTLENSRCVDIVIFSPDGMFIASGGSRAINLWSAQTYELKHILDDFTEMVRQVVISPSIGLIAGRDKSGKVAVFDLRTGARKWALTEGQVPDAPLSPEAEELVAAVMLDRDLIHAVSGEYVVSSPSLEGQRSDMILVHMTRPGDNAGGNLLDPEALAQFRSNSRVVGMTCKNSRVIVASAKVKATPVLLHPA